MMTFPEFRDHVNSMFDKLNAANIRGFTTYVIWEDEFRGNPEGSVLKLALKIKEEYENRKN
jgi:hypothetical protein